jgi:hypothetical protein
MIVEVTALTKATSAQRTLQNSPTRELDINFTLQLSFFLLLAMEKEHKGKAKSSKVKGIDDANLYMTDRTSASIQVVSDLHLEFYPQGKYPKDLFTPCVF